MNVYCFSQFANFSIVAEAQENADQYSNELEKLKSELSRSEEEKKRLDDELTQVCIIILC